ncbi:lysophospholipase [Turicibacter sp. T129]|nr:lysophospholipase [Turicibacter sp. T129]MEE0426403.1 lysophospholipase [Turicibacter sp.]
MGHSMGGAIATYYVLKYNAHSVSKLVLLGAAILAWIKSTE